MTSQTSTYLEYIDKHYNELKERFKKFCSNQHYQFDEDIFSDTLLKIYDIVEKKGLEDMTDGGIENYLFMSFKNNLKREKQYYRNRAKKEITGLSETYDEYYNENNDPPTHKIINDLYQDFSVIYIIRKVEEQFPSEYVYCFKLKFLYKLTYKELQEKAKRVSIKNSRQKTVDVIRWARENISKEEVDKAFDEFKKDFF